MKKLVSVIVPVFKAKDYIERCACSLFEQTYPNIEYIFVNDCTPDNSVELLEDIVKRYPERYPNTKVINFEKNQGHAHARNVALKQCNGDYVIQIDADDWVETDMVEILLKEALENDADMSCCGFYIEKANYREEHFVNADDIGAKGISEGKFVLDYSAHWNKLIRTSLIKDNNIYCVEGTNNWVDVSQILPLRFTAKKIVAVQKCLYHYNACNENSVSKHITMKRIDDMVKIATSVCAFVEKNSQGQYYKQLCHLKLFAKAPMITGNNNLYKRWRSTFPESNRYIWSYPIDRFHKVMYILALFHLSFVYEIAKKINKH